LNRARLLLRISRRSSRALVVIKLLLTLLVIVSAATIDSTPKSFTAELGSAATVPSGLLITDKGFATASSSGTASGTCTIPIIFGPLAGVGNNGITSGHIVYTVRVNSTGSAPALIKYNVTFTMGSTAYGPICIQTAAVPANGQIIDCKFDIAATTLPNSIYTFKVTIQ
jgi:hypothetical protein